MKNIKLHRKRALWLSCLCLPTAILAQEIADDDIIVLEEVEADNVPIEESILPTTRPFISLYGTEKNVLDTPRNVTIVSREQLDAISIRDPRDFSKLTSSAYTQSNFGAPSNPSIRGQSADVLVNGVRRGLTTNGNGLPTNFNAVESVNILKGPPSVSVGASQYVGGYVDLITKKPNFAENSNEVTFTADSEGLLVGQIDSNFVIDDSLAIRTSITVEGTDDYFYNNFKRETEAFYVGLTWKPNEKYRLELNGEYFHAEYTENWGWNRVTKDLIDNERYLAGGPNDTDFFLTDVNQVSPASVAGTPEDVAAAIENGSIFNPANKYPLNFVFQEDVLDDEDNLIFSAGDGIPGTQFGPVTVEDDPELVSIDREDRLLADDDDSDGFLITLQGIQTWTPSTGNQITNNTLYQYRDRDTYSSYQYSEVLSDNWMVENRTEYQTKFDLFDVLHKINLGSSFRFTTVEAANDFFHEPANFWDITQEIPGVTDGFVFFDNPYTFFTSASVPILGEGSRGNLTLGRPGSVGGNYGTFNINPDLLPDDLVFYDNPDTAEVDPTVTYNANGDTNDSDTWQIGFFAQDDVEISEKIDFLIGGRVDVVAVETEDPLFDDAVAFLDQYGADGEADRLRGIGRDEASEVEVLYNWNSSLVYKPTDNTSVYFTYNWAEAPPVGLGGGISVQQAENEDAFVRESELFELGFKASFFDNKLFMNTAIYEQTRTDPVQGGGSVETEAEGFEFELNYQPSKQFYAVFGYSYTDATSDLNSNFVANGAVEGSIISNNAAFLTGSSKTPGVPEHLINFLVAYKFTDNFGITAAGVGTSEVNLTYEQANFPSVEIPWQYSLDLGAFYETENWSLRFNILNATDEENFGAVNPIYGNASVFVELPRRYEFTASYKF